MCQPDEIFGAVCADVIISALVICGLILLGVFTYRVIVRTRKRATR